MELVSLPIIIIALSVVWVARMQTNFAPQPVSAVAVGIAATIAASIAVTVASVVAEASVGAAVSLVQSALMMVTAVDPISFVTVNDGTAVMDNTKEMIHEVKTRLGSCFHTNMLDSVWISGTMFKVSSGTCFQV